MYAICSGFLRETEHMSNGNLANGYFWHESDARDFVSFMYKMKCQQAACDRYQHYLMCSKEIVGYIHLYQLL